METLLILWHARIQKVLADGVQLRQHFLVDEGSKDPKYHYKGHLNGVSLACRCWPNIQSGSVYSFVVCLGIRTSIAKKTYIFVIF